MKRKYVHVCNLWQRMFPSLWEICVCFKRAVIFLFFQWPTQTEKCALNSHKWNTHTHSHTNEHKHRSGLNTFTSHTHFQSLFWNSRPSIHFQYKHKISAHFCSMLLDFENVHYATDCVILLVISSSAVTWCCVLVHTVVLMLALHSLPVEWFPCEFRKSKVINSAVALTTDWPRLTVVSFKAFWNTWTCSNHSV